MSKKTLEELIRLEEDIHEIENLISRYFHFHSIGMEEEVKDTFARENPGTKIEMVAGVYQGSEGLEKYYSEKPGEDPMEFHTGAHMIMLPQTAPYIEVAGDGKTAKGMWLLPGLGTNTDDSLVGKRLQAHWSYARYGVDFIKEDGSWKIWHLHVYGVFRPRYERSWVDHFAHGILGPAPGSAEGPDGPPTYSWEWTPLMKTENIPQLPEPYETWDDSLSYIP